MRYSEDQVRIIVNDELERFARELGLEWLRHAGAVVGTIKLHHLPAEVRFPEDDKLNALIEHLGLVYVGEKPTFQPIKKKGGK